MEISLKLRVLLSVLVNQEIVYLEKESYVLCQVIDKFELKTQIK